MEQKSISEMSQEEVAHAIVQRRAAGEKMGEIFEIDEGLYNVFERQAFELYRIGQFDKARVIAQGIIALDENRHYANKLLGDIFLQESKIEESISFFERARDANPKDSFVTVKLAEAHIRQGNPEEAQKYLLETIELTNEENRDHRRAKKLMSSIQTN